MPYINEISFIERFFSKCRLQFLLVDPLAEPEHRIDFGLRELLELQELYSCDFKEHFSSAAPRRIYRFTDRFQLKYLFFSVPDQSTSRRLAVVGPFITEEMTHEYILEQAELKKIPASLVPKLDRHMAMVPILPDGSPIMAALETFGELIWGEGGFTGMELISSDGIDQPFDWEMTPQAGITDIEMRSLEARYEKENEIMRAVAGGQLGKAETLLSSFSAISFEKRVADGLRNLKNYCIIMNTLLRKAAEQGGVHPVELDRSSAFFARKIEETSNSEMVHELMAEMLQDYCRLVKTHATAHYSPVIQKVILHIGSNLSGDLGLKTLAAKEGINSAYLSSLFKQELGITLTDYISSKRVQHAKHLLLTTKLQIQTIAQHCGIPDVNYFSKVFKKHTGKTPKEYRLGGLDVQ